MKKMKTKRKFFKIKSTGLSVVWTYIKYVGWMFDIHGTVQVILSYLIINADNTRIVDISDHMIRQIADKLNTTSQVVYNAVEELYQKGAIIRRINGTEIVEDLFLQGIKDSTEMTVEFSFKH